MHRFGQASGHREPEPNADGAAGVAEPLEGQEDPVPVSLGTPGPWSTTRRTIPVSRALAVNSGGDPAGEYRSASAVTFAMTRSMIGGSAMTRGRPGGMRTMTARDCGRCR